QFAEPDTPFLAGENRDGIDEADAITREKVAEYQRQNAQLNKRIASRKIKEQADAKIGENGLDPGDEASQARMRKNILRHNWELHRGRPIAFAVYTGKTVTRNSVQSRLKVPSNPWGKGSIEPDTILTGGDPFTRGDQVAPGPLSAATLLGGMRDQPFEFPADRAARRLALARWITNPSNPLAARVIVNRVWSWHFGRGIAANPNNLGGTGGLPTHPRLLDTLTQWFIENGWSIRKLNQLIVTSDAYRRGSRLDRTNQKQRPPGADDLYLTFSPRRLSAEELRDAMLAASGELNRQVGGIPCRPDINMEVAMQPRQIMGGTASVYEPDPRPQRRNRRTLYCEKIRGLRDPFLETFNQPGPDRSCELRETSTVAPQALTMLNAQEMQDRAIALAAALMKKMKEDNGADRARVIDRLFLQTLARHPDESEIAGCLEHWLAMTDVERGRVYTPQDFPAQVQRTVMAEKTGQPYSFIESMPAYKRYVPDLGPSDVTPAVRGLAQVCLVVMNTNEFSYLD
ncbi:MAG: DUF1553 domain-containing protein, partial [Planctomycetota bacterium]